MPCQVRASIYLANLFGSRFIEVLAERGRRMARQAELFDIDERPRRLSDLGDQLEAYASAVGLEIFRADLDRAVQAETDLRLDVDQHSKNRIVKSVQRRP